MTKTRIVGQPLPRIDAASKVRGEAVFAADVRLPQMLVGKFLPSPHAHARILSIDTTAAESLPGVRAVITAADIPAVDSYDPESRFHAFLARPFVVFAGQPVAAVAADDLATAEAALELIAVEYQLLPAILTVEEAIQPGRPSVSRNPPVASASHDQASRASETQEANREGLQSPNISYHQISKYGDLRAGFAASDVIVERTYTMPTVHQGYIEPHAVTAFWDSADHVTVWAAVQGAFAARDLIADTLGIPLANITLNTTEIGGGFGGKAECIFSPLAVLLAKKAQRPVKLVLTRREELVSANPAPSTVIWLKTGVKSDGTLMALEGKIWMDTGAFGVHWIMQLIMMLVRNNYRFQAWHLDAKEVLTNKASASAYRAPGAVNAAFAIESQLDEIANQLGLDPLELRLKNLALEGDLLADLKPQVKIGTKEVLLTLAGHPAWTNPPPPRLGGEGWLRGRGLALGSWGGARGPAGTIAILEADGTFRIVLGTVDLSGSFTSLAQIAAEALGVSIGQIIVTKASPDYVPFAPMSAGSQTIYAMGAAVKEAALDLRAKIFNVASEALHVPEAELDINEEGVFVVADLSQSRSFQLLYQLGTQWFSTHGPLVGVGSAPLRQLAPGSAASVAEVAVDPETGKVTLIRLTTVQDVGKAINPLSVEGQIQGGSTQSVGIALWEEVMYDEQGQAQNANLLDYKMATAADMPMIEAIMIETPGGDGPYGAKIVGEPPAIPAVAAVANAVASAIGTRICDLPITPERIWRLLNGNRRNIG